MSVWKKCLCLKSARGKFWYASTPAEFAEPISRKSQPDHTQARAFLVTRPQVSSPKLAKESASSLAAIAALCFITSRVENVITHRTRPLGTTLNTKMSDARLASSRRAED